MALDALDIKEKLSARDNLGVFLNSHGISCESNVYKHIKHLAEIGQLYLAGGSAREFFRYRIESLIPNENSVSKFETDIGFQIPDLKKDFEKALKVGKKITELNFDLDLIVPKVPLSYFMWNLLSSKEKGFKTKVERDPLRYSISSTQDSGLNFKIDVVDIVGNARLGNCSTTFDSILLPVDQNLDLYGMSLYKNSIPMLTMLGNAYDLKRNPNSKISLAVAVRFITQSLMIYSDNLGQKVNTSVYLGKGQEAKETCIWLLTSLDYLIQNKEENAYIYSLFLYTVIPNWELFSEPVKIIIKNAFALRQRIK